MKYDILNEQEMRNHEVGEALTVASVMAIAIIAVMAVVIFQLYRSKKGTAQIPGGWKFTWN